MVSSHGQAEIAPVRHHRMRFDGARLAEPLDGVPATRLGWAIGETPTAMGCLPHPGG